MSETITSFFRKVASVPPVFLDGATFVLIQMLTFLSASFGSDQAAKFIEAKTLWILQISIGGLASGFLALKMFRSTAYADDKRKKENGNGGHTG